MQVRFEKREQLAPTIWQYTFAPERRVDFIPGQYVEFRMPELEGDPRGRNRTFTLTSLPRLSIRGLMSILRVRLPKLTIRK